jgi:hypothetical protein
MCHLLLDYFVRQEDARSALSDLQESFPFELFAQVVYEQ